MFQKKYAEFDEDVLKSWMTDIVQEDVNGVCTLTGKTIYNSAGGGAGFQSFSETKYIPVNVKGHESIPRGYSYLQRKTDKRYIC